MQRWVVVACLATIAYSAVIGLMRFLGSEGEPGRLRISGSLVAPFVVAALAALVAHWAGRGRFLMAAGAGIIPAAVVSVVALPLWIPAILLVVVGWRETAPGKMIEMIASMVVTVGIFASMIVLLVHDDPIEWIHDGIDNYSSDTITASESLLSATILGLVLMVALAAARPRVADEASADEASADEASADEASADEASADEASADDPDGRAENP